MPVFSIVLGLIIALAVPGLFDGRFKRKRKKQAFARLCQIIGFSIIVVAVRRWLFYFKLFGI